MLYDKFQNESSDYTCKDNHFRGHKGRKEEILCEQKRVNKSELLYAATTQKRFFRFKCLETFRVALMEEAILSLNKSTVKTVLAVFFIHPTRQKPSHINASKIYR